MRGTGKAAGQPPAARPLLTWFLLALLLAWLMVRPVAMLTRPASALYSDFDFFYAGAKATLAGDASSAYNETWFRNFQKRNYGIDLQGPWTYPPPFNLVVAPFGLVNRGWAFLLFMQGSLLAYLLALRRIAGPWLTPVLALLLPMIMMVIFFGQNGLLTGALVGFTCVGLSERKRWAGVPLGLMVIKPHLAIGFAIYVVASRDWRTFLTAGAVVGLAAAVTTLILGTSVWPAFLSATGFAGQKLSSGYFPFYRMVSAYAAARIVSIPPGLAAIAQLVSATLAIGLIIVAQRRLPVRQALGITTIASLLISPYAFDYDLPMVGIGLALLTPDLSRMGRPIELAGLYALFLGAAVYGLLAWTYKPQPLMSFAFFELAAVLAITWIILGRDGQAEAAPA